jgi:hypothetical protein
MRDLRRRRHPGMAPVLLRPTVPAMRALLLLLSLSMVLAARGAEPFSLDRLAAAHQQTRTLRVTFTQEKHLAILDEPVVSRGLIELSRPLEAVRWEFSGKSVLLFKDGRLRRFGAEGKEETVGGGKDQSASSMIGQMKAFLHGDFSSMKEIFTITPDAGGAPLLRFAPKTADLARYITSLEIRWRDDLTAPQHMLLVAAGDDRTEYRFDPPQVDIEIPLERFTGP